MAELLKFEDIPDTKSGHGAIYPWDEWAAELTNGNALRLARADMPEGSGAYKNWDNATKRRGALNGAPLRGLKMAIRGEFVYLWKAQGGTR